MKLVLSILTLSFATLAFGVSQKVDLYYAEDAVIHFCAENADANCRTTITLGGKLSYVLTTTGAAAVQLRPVEESYQFQHEVNTQPGPVIGFFATERGRLTFKAIDIGIVPVRGMRP